MTAAPTQSAGTVPPGVARALRYGLGWGVAFAACLAAAIGLTILDTGIVPMCGWGRFGGPPPTLPLETQVAYSMQTAILLVGAYWTLGTTSLVAIGLRTLATLSVAWVVSNAALLLVPIGCVF